jgi:phosphoserine aminotransferase
MTRPFNFSAGPATLPEEVLQQAAREMLDWQGSGMGVMEMSHRGKDFISIAQQAEADLPTSASCSCKAAPSPRTPSCR